MRVLGLTGGIGSGKSIVASMFAEMGAHVIDADQLARDVVEPGQPALEEIVKSFGRNVLLPDGGLNRGKLAAIIFADPSARARLNAITHPRILERMRAGVEARRMREGVLILDVPLLYENERSDLVEKVIVVWVDRQTQVRRLTERDGLTAREVEQRIAAQMPLDEKRARADHVIDNTGTMETTREQVEAIYRMYAATPHPGPSPQRRREP